MEDLNKDLSDVQKATNIVANNAEHLKTPNTAGYTKVAQTQPEAPKGTGGAAPVTVDEPEEQVEQKPKEVGYHIEKENPEGTKAPYIGGKPGLPDTKIKLVPDNEHHGLKTRDGYLPEQSKREETPDPLAGHKAPSVDTTTVDMGQTGSKVIREHMAEDNRKLADATQKGFDNAYDINSSWSAKNYWSRLTDNVNRKLGR